MLHTIMKITLDLLDGVRPLTMDGLMPSSVFDEPDRSGWPEARVLYTWYYAVSRLTYPKIIVEIGVLSGLSLAAMMMGSAKSTGVGFDNESYRKNSLVEASNNLLLCSLGQRFLMLSKDSQTIARKDFPDCDLMHVDGDHTYAGCLNDLNLSVGHCKNVLVDDYHSHPEVKRAVDYWTTWHKNTIKNVLHLPTKNGLVLIQS